MSWYHFLHLLRKKHKKFNNKKKKSEVFCSKRINIKRLSMRFNRKTCVSQENQILTWYICQKIWREREMKNFSWEMDESKNALLNKLQEGSLFVKFNVDGSLNEGFFYICPKLKSLCYNVSKKRFQNSTNECKTFRFESKKRKHSLCFFLF